MHVYLRGSLQQKLRLVSGLVLFTFAATHFLNHALGLVSLEAMHHVQEWRTTVTRSAPGTFVLALALVTHIALALYKLSRRKTWRMPRWEAVQIALGLAIPFFLFPHIVNTRIARTFFDVQDSYLYELVRLWPDSAVTQSTLLLLVWTHGCLGLHYWLRLSDGYRRVLPLLAVAAVAVPVLALAGFVVGGRTTGEIMTDTLAFAELKARSNWPNAEDSVTLAWLRMAARVGFFVLAATAIGIAIMRQLSRAVLSGKVRVLYEGGPTLTVAPGKTLLEISRSAGISHASVCGGRGRCSTCRVRIEAGLGSLPPPVGAEAITLKSIEAPDNIRLACQIRPTRDLAVAIISRPAIPGPPQESFDDIREYVAAHVRAILGEHLVEVRASDAEAVTRWLAGQGAPAIEVPDLGAAGFGLEGARIDFVSDRSTAAIVYRRRERPMTLFQAPLGETAPLAMRGHRNGYQVLAWTDERFAFVAVSDLPFTDLDAAETAIRPAEPLLKLDASAALM
jgi:ferredoxin